MPSLVVILSWCFAVMPLSYPLIFVQRVPKTWTCLKHEHTRTRVDSQIMCTSGTCFTESWVSVGSSIWLCLGQHFDTSLQVEQRGTWQPGQLVQGAQERGCSPLVQLLGTEVFPSCTSGQAEDRGSFLHHMQQEGISWFWRWRYQNSEQEALKPECGGLGRCSPALSLEHWPIAPGESVLPGVWSRMQPMAKVASKRAV